MTTANKQYKWNSISGKYKLSEAVIRKNNAYVTYDTIWKRQRVSEQYIKDYIDQANWDLITKYQDMSYTFILELMSSPWDVVFTSDQWKNILIYQNISLTQSEEVAIQDFIHSDAPTNTTLYDEYFYSIVFTEAKITSLLAAAGANLYNYLKLICRYQSSVLTHAYITSTLKGYISSLADSVLEQNIWDELTIHFDLTVDDYIYNNWGTGDTLATKVTPYLLIRYQNLSQDFVMDLQIENVTYAPFFYGPDIGTYNKNISDANLQIIQDANPSLAVAVIRQPEYRTDYPMAEIRELLTQHNWTVDGTEVTGYVKYKRNGRTLDNKFILTAGLTIEALHVDLRDNVIFTNGIEVFNGASILNDDDRLLYHIAQVKMQIVPRNLDQNASAELSLTAPSNLFYEDSFKICDGVNQLLITFVKNYESALDVVVHKDINRRIRVSVATLGTPDTISWFDYSNGTSGTGVSITGASQEIVDGLYLNFSATTGHQLGDYWTFNVTSRGKIEDFIHFGTGLDDLVPNVTTYQNDTFTFTISGADCVITSVSSGTETVYGILPNVWNETTWGFRFLLDAVTAADAYTLLIGVDGHILATLTTTVGVNNGFANGLYENYKSPLTTYSSYLDRQYEIEITATGAGDTIEWRNLTKDTSGSILLTDLNTDLEDGIILTWGALTGHTLGDIWSFSVQFNAYTGLSMTTGSGLDDLSLTGAYDAEPVTDYVTLDGSFDFDTGDEVYMSDITLPKPLVQNTTYYAIKKDVLEIQFALSLSDANNGLAINLEETGVSALKLRAYDTAVYDVTNPNGLTMDINNLNYKQDVHDALNGIFNRTYAVYTTDTGEFTNFYVRPYGLTTFNIESNNNVEGIVRDKFDSRTVSVDLTASDDTIELDYQDILNPTIESTLMLHTGAPVTLSGTASHDGSYFIIEEGLNKFKLATSYVNAVAGTVVDVTVDDSGTLTSTDVLYVEFPDAVYTVGNTLSADGFDGGSNETIISIQKLMHITANTTDPIKLANMLANNKPNGNCKYAINFKNFIISLTGFTGGTYDTILDDISDGIGVIVLDTSILRTFNLDVESLDFYNDLKF